MSRRFLYTLDDENKCFRLWIPVDSITHIDIRITPLGKDTAECIPYLPGSLEFLSKHTTIDLKMTEETVNDNIKKILPSLTNFCMNKLNLDLNYSNKSLFEAICYYVDKCKEAQICNHLSVSIFDQAEFEIILKRAENTHLKSLYIKLYCDAIPDIRKLIYDFRKLNPFMTLVVKYDTERMSAFNA